METSVTAGEPLEEALELFCRALDEVNRLERRPVCSAIEYVLRQQNPGFELPTADGVDMESLAAQAERRGLVRLASVGGDLLVQRVVATQQHGPVESATEVAWFRELIEKKLKCPVPPAPVRQRVFETTDAILTVRQPNPAPISLRDLSYSVKERIGPQLTQTGVFKLLFALVLGNAFVIERNPRLHQIGILKQNLPVERWDDVFLRACYNALRRERPDMRFTNELLAKVMDTPIRQIQIHFERLSSGRTMPQLRCAILLILAPLLVSASVPKRAQPEAGGALGRSDGGTVGRLDSRTVGRLDSCTVGQSNRPTVSPSDRPTVPPSSSWSPAAFSRYDSILSRMPFGQPPPAPPVKPTPPPPVVPPPPPPFATKLVLSAINRTPSGNVDVGFVDNSQNPPHCYVMNQNETQDGFTVLKADFEGEFAIVEKGGTAVTLWIHATERRVITDIASAIQAENASGQNNKAEAQQLAMAQPPRVMFSTRSEELLSMIASAEPGTAPPPLPISDDDDDAEEIAKTLKTAIVIHADDDEHTVKHKENVAWMKDDMRKSLETNNETGTSYIKRLYERQKAIEQERAAEAANLRKMAEKVSQERLQAALEAVNARLQEQGIPALGQRDAGIETDDEP